MGWKLLKKRRWEGPYSSEELRRMLQEKKIVGSDFVLDEFNNEKFPSNYKTVSELLGVEIKPTKAKAKSQASEVISEDKEHSFSEFDREEVTKLFDEQVEPADLLQSKKSDSFSSSASLGSEDDFENSSNEGEGGEPQGYFYRMKSLPLNRVASTLVIVLLLGFVVYGANEIFDFGSMVAQKSEGEKARVPASTTTRTPRVQPKPRPSSRPSRVRERIKLPSSRPRPAPGSQRAPSNYEDDYRDDDYVEQSQRPKARRGKRGRRDTRDRLYEDDLDDGYEDDREREPYGDSDDRYTDEVLDDRRGGDYYRDERPNEGYGDEEDIEEYRDEEVENNYDY
ncbi:hypothetical protein GW915_04300 [bacterium]|nr:hypothetical protein [bacterium]